jgi:hypothetical protein
LNAADTNRKGVIQMAKQNKVDGGAEHRADLAGLSGGGVTKEVTRGGCPAYETRPGKDDLGITKPGPGGSTIHGPADFFEKKAKGKK